MKKSKNLGVYLSDTSYGGILRALTNMYCASGKDMYQVFKKELSQLMSGMKRVIASNKRQDVIGLEEGNNVMSSDVYKPLYDVLHQGEGEELFFHIHF